jgi:ferritin-like metal-binding protein YciE
MQTPHELFVHELSDMLDAEQRILEALQELEEETNRSDLQKAFSQHRAQTQNQLDRLQKCFASLEEQPQQQECHGIRGILEEKESFEQEDPSEELKEVFNIGGASKVEHYEIAAYNGLIDLAQKLGQRQAARLLQQNLREEQQMLKKCEGFIKKYKPAPMEEPEEAGQTRRRGSSRSRSRRAA